MRVLLLEVGVLCSLCLVEGIGRLRSWPGPGTIQAHWQSRLCFYVLAPSPATTGRIIILGLQVKEGKIRKSLCSIEVQACKVKLEAFLTLKKPVPTEKVVLISVTYIGHFFNNNKKNSTRCGGGGWNMCFLHTCVWFSIRRWEPKLRSSCMRSKYAYSQSHHSTLNFGFLSHNYWQRTDIT